MKVTHMNTFLNTGYPIILQILAKYLDIYIYTHNFDKLWMIRPHKCPPVVNSVSWSNCRDVVWSRERSPPRVGIGGSVNPARGFADGDKPRARRKRHEDRSRHFLGSAMRLPQESKPNIFFIHFASSTHPSPGEPLTPSLGSPSAPYTSDVFPKEGKGLRHRTADARVGQDQRNWFFCADLGLELIYTMHFAKSWLKGAKVNLHSGFRSFKAWMGKENKKGIEVKPDKLVRICFLGEKEQEGRGISQSRFQSVNFNLWFLFEQSRLLPITARLAIWIRFNFFLF